MPETLLRTKLRPPPRRPDLVRRPRLVERLNQALRSAHRLTLISAPAGFGKTTLIGEWMADLRAQGSQDVGQINAQINGDVEDFAFAGVAWLSLDAGDQDPDRFLAYCIGALNEINGIGGAIGKPLAMLRSPVQPSLETILTSLINEISALPLKFVFVLDDYHVLDSRVVDTALAFLLEHLPPQMHLVIATRRPATAGGPSGANGQLTELRAADLRFSSTEAAAFLKQMLGVDLTAEDVCALDDRTEGWIAGLQLAAIYMQGQSDPSKYVESFTGSHRFVLDYLIEEVLEQQPDEIYTFLLSTAILDNFTAPLCDALTGESNGQALLDRLEHANLFIVPLDEDRRWYRYHHLFADLLRRHLRQVHPEWIPALHRRAAAWYEQQAFVADAIEHALLGHEFDHAARLIEDSVDDIWQLGEQPQLRRWLAQLPHDVISANPHLCILHAGDLFATGQIEDVDHLIETATQSLEQLAHDDPQSAARTRKLRGRAFVLKAHLLAHLEEDERAIDHARLALIALPEDDTTWRWSALDSLGTVYGYIDTAAAYQARIDALHAAETAGNDYLVLLASLRLVVSLRELGRLNEAAEICRQQAKRADECGLAQTALAGWLYALWGEIRAEMDDLERAYDLVSRGITLTEHGADVTLRGSSYLCQMRVLYSRGDMAEAQLLANKVIRLAHTREVSSWITYQMMAWQARICISQGHIQPAIRWAEQLHLDVGADLTPMHDFDYGILARLLIAQGNPDDAQFLLERFLALAESTGRTAKQIEILLLLALTHQAQDRTDDALTVLARALALAEPGGFVRTFVDEGPALARLLYAALARNHIGDYVQRLLTAFPVRAAETPQPAPSDDLDNALLEPLSERELEVLQLVADGLTNPEIAEQLVLSLNTVKVHSRNIHGKLAVHTRTQAVARARALGLLPAN
ncbi:MAG: LuxR C-terminal-related transcriptional regulator [Caldilineaceae bacterium]